MRGAVSPPTDSKIGMRVNVSTAQIVHETESAQTTRMLDAKSSRISRQCSAQRTSRAWVRSALHEQGAERNGKSKRAFAYQPHIRNCHLGSIGHVFPGYLAPPAITLRAVYVRRLPLGRTARDTSFEWVVRRSARGEVRGIQSSLPHEERRLAAPGIARRVAEASLKPRLPLASESYC